jgi:hypothetical protein
MEIKWEKLEIAKKRKVDRSKDEWDFMELTGPELHISGYGIVSRVTGIKESDLRDRIGREGFLMRIRSEELVRLGLRMDRVGDLEQERERLRHTEGGDTVQS